MSVVAYIAHERPCKESPYLTWAKSLSTAECTLAGSGAPPCTIWELGGPEPDAPLTERNDYGWPPLVERIAARYAVAPASVVIAAGASMANHLAMATVLSRGDHVLVEHPAYDPLHLVPRLWGAAVTSFPRRASDEFRLDLDAIRALLIPTTRLVVLSNLHNPSGALAREADLGALAELAETHGFHVLVDEVYRECVHGTGDGDGSRSAATIGPRMIVTSSLTKAFGLNGLRIGWIVAEAPLAERMRRFAGLFDNIPAHPSERLAVRALDRAEAILAPRRALVGENLARLSAWVAATPGVRWVKPAGGGVGWIDLGIGDVTSFAERLAEKERTLVAPGSFFGAPDHVRVALGVEPAVLAQGLERISTLLRQYRR